MRTIIRQTRSGAERAARAEWERDATPHDVYMGSRREPGSQCYVVLPAAYRNRPHERPVVLYSQQLVTTMDTEGTLTRLPLENL